MSFRGALNPGLVIVLILLLFLAIAALLVDPVRTTYGLKGDEATYVTMALSIAYDGDLSFDEGDLARFWPIYQSGPEGIFLKRTAAREGRLYFGKAFIYPAVAAPFIRVAGLNGLLFLNVLLLAVLFVCLYVFAAARIEPTGALLLSAGFLGASVTPLYAVWLMPEMLNVTLVGSGYFCWLYKEVRPRPSGVSASHAVWGRRSDILAAVLLGLATFSKPSNLALALPLIALAWWRKQLAHGVVIGLVFGLVVAGGFGVNGLISGELNYQGGDRKTFYGQYPFQSPEATFDNRGIAVTTDSLEFEGWRHLARNSGYFVMGRHFGLLPYFFPAIVIAAWAIRRWRSLSMCHLLIAGAIGGTAVGLLLLLPNTWSGGGGPAGNRYFLSVYPAFFFLMPVARSVLPGVLMWTGGALFVAQILVDPFVAAKRPWQNTQQGLFRHLPVELTMVNDLPVQLDQGRSRIPYGQDPQLLLYYLDENAWRPEDPGIWIGGETRADIVVRTNPAIQALDITLRSPVPNSVTVTVDGTEHRTELAPNDAMTIRAPVDGVYARGAQTFVLSVETTAGFVPSLRNPTSNDPRFLGVLLRAEGVATMTTQDHDK